MTDVENTGCFSAPPGGRKGICEEFRDFILGGNFIRLAAAFVLALALESLIKSLVSSFITPVLGIIGSRNFNDLDFTVRGSRFAYGEFINAAISFLTIGMVIFFCLILPVQRYGGKCAPAWVQTFCEYCCQQIPAIATKCPHCCSAVTPVPVHVGRQKG